MTQVTLDDFLDIIETESPATDDEREASRGWDT